MPPGVFEHIVEFMPLPRVWEHSIERFGTRAKIAQHQTVLDAATLMDEILCDLVVFKSSNQKNLLVRLARSPEVRIFLYMECCSSHFVLFFQVMTYLVEKKSMPKGLVDLLVQWSDMQSLVNRTSDNDVLFRPGFARHFVRVALHLLKYYRVVTSPAKMVTAWMLKYRSQLGPIKSVTLPPSITNDPHLACILGSLTNPSTPPGAAGTPIAEMGRSQLSMNDNDDMITDAGGDEEEEDGDEIEDSDDIS
jgi:hypothetical protein